LAGHSEIRRNKNQLSVGITSIDFQTVLLGKIMTEKVHLKHTVQLEEAYEKGYPALSVPDPGQI
jgi:hypothetical protein